MAPEKLNDCMCGSGCDALQNSAYIVYCDNLTLNKMCISYLVCKTVQVNLALVSILPLLHIYSMSLHEANFLVFLSTVEFVTAVDFGRFCFDAIASSPNLRLFDAHRIGRSSARTEQILQR